MICDIVKIFLTTAFALIPDDYVPAQESRTAITVTVVRIVQPREELKLISNFSIYSMNQTCEIFYFSSCLMHVLFAIHRLIFIVFPKRKEVWASYTNLAIAVCVAFAVVKSFLTQMLGINLLFSSLWDNVMISSRKIIIADNDLYLMFDRNVMSWLFTMTPKTILYKKWQLMINKILKCVFQYQNVSLVRGSRRCIHSRCHFIRSVDEAEEKGNGDFLIDQARINCWYRVASGTRTIQRRQSWSCRCADTLKMELIRL